MQSVAQDLGHDRHAPGSGTATSARWPLAPLAAAAGLHLLLLGFVVTRPLASVGMDAADPNAVTVEVLDAAAFDERFPSSIARRSIATSVPQPAVPAVQVQPEPQPEQAPAASVPPQPPTTSKPAADDALALLSDPLPAPKPSLDLKLPPAAAHPPKSAQKPMSAAEFVARQLGGSAKERAGQIDEFTRDVLRKLEQAKPDLNGKAGEAVVTLVVGLSGEVEDLKISQSSGDLRLDRQLLAAFHDLRFVPPPNYADIHDRSFDVAIHAK